MIERSIAHGTFTVKRTYPFPPAKVFRAWADPAIKRMWYGGADQDDARQVFEFRPGGRELRFGKAGDQDFAIAHQYYDIVADQRIVYAYDVQIDNVLTSVSIAAVEFKAKGDGTELVMTEQGAFLDGLDKPEERIVGNEWVLDRLGEVLPQTA